MRADGQLAATDPPVVQPAAAEPCSSLRRRMPDRTSMRVVPASSNVAPGPDELREHLLFADLTHGQLADLRSTCSIETLNAGQRLYERGQSARNFYMVLEGQVHLALHSSNGEEKIVEIIRAREIFAEAVMFLEEPSYQLTAIAATSTRIAGFSSARYLGFLRENPETSLRMLGHMSRRLHGRIRDIEHLSFASANDRLVRFLLGRIAGHVGPVELQLNESRQELAALLSMQPETLSRGLRALGTAGALQVDGRRLRVHSRELLEAQLQSSG